MKLFLLFATSILLAVEAVQQAREIVPRNSAGVKFHPGRIRTPLKRHGRATESRRRFTGRMHRGRIRHEVPNLTSQDIDVIVRTHNSLRKRVDPPASNMRRMKWNERLASIAADYAGKCIYEHSESTKSGNNEFDSQLGENIYIISGGDLNLIHAIRQWYDEVKDYNYSTRHCSGMCGHYTQVVWADSVEIGCAYVNCHGQVLVRNSYWTDPRMLVCNYFLPGNVVRTFLFGHKIPDPPYKTGEPCSQCKYKDDVCADNLCDGGSNPTSGIESQGNFFPDASPDGVSLPDSEDQANDWIYENAERIPKDPGSNPDRIATTPTISENAMRSHKTPIEVIETEIFSSVLTLPARDSEERVPPSARSPKTSISLPRLPTRTIHFRTFHNNYFDTDPTAPVPNSRAIVFYDDDVRTYPKDSESADERERNETETISQWRQRMNIPVELEKLFPNLEDIGEADVTIIEEVPAGRIYPDHSMEMTEVVEHPARSISHGNDIVGDVLEAYDITLNNDDIMGIMDEHAAFRENLYPAAANVRKLHWSDDIARDVDEYIKRCVGLVVNQPTENWKVTSNDVSRRSIIEEWRDEQYNYDWDTGKCLYGTCSHYLKLARASFDQVGCARTRCSGRVEIDGVVWDRPYVFMCRYGPESAAQNDQSPWIVPDTPARPYTAGKSCSTCREGDVCVNQMCDKPQLMTSPARLNVTSSPDRTLDYEAIEISHCLCQNGGRCVPDFSQEAGLGAYTCECPFGIYGKYCNDSIRDCLPGLTGPSCITDIDECLENPCYEGVQCYNLIGTYLCGECPEGYFGDGITCQDFRDIYKGEDSLLSPEFLGNSSHGANESSDVIRELVSNDYSTWHGDDESLSADIKGSEAPDFGEEVRENQNVDEDIRKTPSGNEGNHGTTNINETFREPPYDGVWIHEGTSYGDEDILETIIIVGDIREPLDIVTSPQATTVSPSSQGSIVATTAHETQHHNESHHDDEVVIALEKNYGQEAVPPEEPIYELPDREELISTTQKTSLVVTAHEIPHDDSSHEQRLSDEDEKVIEEVILPFETIHDEDSSEPTTQTPELKMISTPTPYSEQSNDAETAHEEYHDDLSQENEPEFEEPENNIEATSSSPIPIDESLSSPPKSSHETLYDDLPRDEENKDEGREILDEDAHPSAGNTSHETHRDDLPTIEDTTEQEVIPPLEPIVEASTSRDKTTSTTEQSISPVTTKAFEQPYSRDEHTPEPDVSPSQESPVSTYAEAKPTTNKPSERPIPQDISHEIPHLDELSHENEVITPPLKEVSEPEITDKETVPSEDETIPEWRETFEPIPPDYDDPEETTKEDVFVVVTTSTKVTTTTQKPMSQATDTSENEKGIEIDSSTRPSSTVKAIEKKFTIKPSTVPIITTVTTEPTREPVVEPTTSTTTSEPPSTTSLRPDTSTTSAPSVTSKPTTSTLSHTTTKPSPTKIIEKVPLADSVEVTTTFASLTTPRSHRKATTLAPEYQGVQKPSTTTTLGHIKTTENAPSPILEELISTSASDETIASEREYGPTTVPIVEPVTTTTPKRTTLVHSTRSKTTITSSEHPRSTTTTQSGDILPDIGLVTIESVVATTSTILEDAIQSASTTTMGPITAAGHTNVFIKPTEGYAITTGTPDSTETEQPVAPLGMDQFEQKSTNATNRPTSFATKSTTSTPAEERLQTTTMKPTITSKTNRYQTESVSTTTPHTTSTSVNERATTMSTTTTLKPTPNASANHRVDLTAPSAPRTKQTVEKEPEPSTIGTTEITTSDQATTTTRTPNSVETPMSETKVTNLGTKSIKTTTTTTRITNPTTSTETTSTTTDGPTGTTSMMSDTSTKVTTTPYQQETNARTRSSLPTTTTTTTKMTTTNPTTPQPTTETGRIRSTNPDEGKEPTITTQLVATTKETTPAPRKVTSTPRMVKMIKCKKTESGKVCVPVMRRMKYRRGRKKGVTFGGRPLKYYISRKLSRTKFSQQDCQRRCGSRGKCVASGMCKCLPQYAGQFCERSACDVMCKKGGVCISRNQCRCVGGYYGTSCEKYKCVQKCRNGGKCVGPNTCECRSGFSGKTCTTPVCTPGCENGGKCHAGNYCKCVEGYSGRRCEKAICEPECLNGGTCTKKNVCSCPRSFLGARCQISVCTPACAHGGRCLKDNKCLCRSGWLGTHCTKPTCMEKCANDGVCIAPNTCKCKTGWSGSTCRTGHCARRCRFGSRCVSPNNCRCPYGRRGKRCRLRAGYSRRASLGFRRF